MKENCILITGVAGFIGMHVAERFLSRGIQVVGVDNINEYYSTALKQSRIYRLKLMQGFTFHEADIANSQHVDEIFARYKFDSVIHLAAQAGVRYSLEAPEKYSQSNLVGFVNILEAIRHASVRHFLFASSSSVYGNNKKTPFSETDDVSHPISLYAATKRANELMAYSYSHLFGIPSTALRFFTVYGPWGRPDMAYFSFTKNIIEARPIRIYNNGLVKRDFTYIDDIVNAIELIADKVPDVGSMQNLNTPFNILNIGNNKPVSVLNFVQILEGELGVKAILEMAPPQPGDVEETYADVTRLNAYIGELSRTPLEIGLQSFVEWYKKYYSI